MSRIVPLGLAAAMLCAQPHQPMQARLEDSAEAAWAKKKVHAQRALDISTLKPVEAGFDKTTVLRLAIPGENWTAYNRLAIRIRNEARGFPMLPLVIAMRNDGVVKVPDVYRRDGLHYVQLPNNRSTEILWEIEPLSRDRVTSLEINYWPNKPLPHPTDYVRYTIESIHLQRVTPDVHEGWEPGAGKLAYSHSGYLPAGRKTAIAAGGAAREFAVLDQNGKAVFHAPSRVVKSRLGEFSEFDFSRLREPGLYTLRAGGAQSRPFRIGEEVWESSIRKTLNLFYAERCGFEVPGIHEACHRDWLATHGDQSIVMNGGWHDAGDLSQGLINTAEATYAMFALARKLEGRNDVLVQRLLEEARWGLDWVLKVRFDGGYRMGFASMNVWTNGVIGDADDRKREALNNANVNYLAASAEAIAYQVLKSRDPALAARALHTAEQDWEYAVEGKDTAETQHTPAFATVEMELASVGILASLELYEATGKPRYADKARALAEIVVASQRKTPAGRDFPLSGFFYNSPAQGDIFHQFHRGNDQAPIVALARLCETFPGDPARQSWHDAVALHAAYLRKKAQTTAPYGVLPAYVYTDTEYERSPENDRYQSSREAYRKQVLNGMPMGDGYYLKNFPVWFGRRGNYGVLLSQTKALSAAARLLRDVELLDLAHQQLQWVAGRNPFAQSTMWGEGYDFAQQYSVSSGDIVGSLPVGMLTRVDRDLPYWPAQNAYVYKEVWVHPSARWLWVMEDLFGE